MEDNKKMKYYNTGNSLGVIGTYPGHISGEYTFLVNNNDPWIRTEDLYDTYEQAENSTKARFLKDSMK